MSGGLGCKAAQVDCAIAYVELTYDYLLVVSSMAYVEYDGAAPTGVDTADSLQVCGSMAYIEIGSGVPIIAATMAYAEILGSGTGGPKYGPRWQQC